MAIDLATGFNIGSKDAIDERQVLTLEQMKNLDESIYPDKYFAICKDDGKLYLYNVNNEVDNETGKFRVLEGSGTSDLTGYKKTYTSKSELFVDSYPTSIKDIIEKLEHGETFLGNTSEYNYSWFPIRISAMFRIIKGKEENLSDTTVEWFSSRTGDYAIAVLSQSAGVERWILIREDGKWDYIDSYPIRKWNLLAKISLSSSDITKHILSFSCLNQVSGTSDGYYYFGKDADLCKYELHFTTPGSSGNLTKYGLVLYEYPMPEGTADGLKNLSKNIGLYYDEDNLYIYIFIINTTDVNYLEGRYIGNGLANCILEYTGKGTIVQSYNRSGSDLLTWDDVYGGVCAFEDLEFPTVVPIGGDGGSAENTKPLHATQLHHTKITAVSHRGLVYYAPGNSNVSLRLAGEYGFERVEFDICETSDGEFILMHDVTVDATTNGTGNVIDMTLAQVKELVLDTGNFNDGKRGLYSWVAQGKYYLQIPTLQEALDICREFGMIPQIEMKNIVNFDKFLQIITDKGFIENCAITSAHVNFLEEIRERNKKVGMRRILQGESNYTDENLEWCAERNIDMDCRTVGLTAEYVNKIHQAGLICNGWIINTEEDLKIAIELGCDSITTDNLTGLDSYQLRAKNNMPHNQITVLKFGVASSPVNDSQKTTDPLTLPSDFKGYDPEVFWRKVPQDDQKRIQCHNRFDIPAGTTSCKVTVPSGIRTAIVGFNSDGLRIYDSGWINEGVHITGVKNVQPETNDPTTFLTYTISDCAFHVLYSSAPNDEKVNETHMELVRQIKVEYINRRMDDYFYSLSELCSTYGLEVKDYTTKELMKALPTSVEIKLRHNKVYDAYKITDVPVNYSYIRIVKSADVSMNSMELHSIGNVRYSYCYHEHSDTEHEWQKISVGHYRIITQSTAGYFKFKPCEDPKIQGIRISVTDNYGGMIDISGVKPTQTQYKPFKCIRLSNGEYTDYDAIKLSNNKMLKLFYYGGYLYLKVTTHTTCIFTSLLEAPTYIETFDETVAEEIPIRSVFDTPYNDGYADPSIIAIGDTASADGVIKTLSGLGFTGDIMTWATGEYRISHVSGLTNLPTGITENSPGFRLAHYDVKKWGSNHNPYVSTYGCRQSVLHYKGDVYIRYTESGATAAVLIVDTGWQKICVETESKKENDSYIPDMYDRNANGDIPVVPFDRLANCIAVRTNRGLVSTTETETTYDEDYVGGYVFIGANDILVKDKEMFNKIKVLVHIPGVLRIGIVNEKIYEANPRYSTCLVKWLVADFVAFTGMKEYDIADTVLEEGQSIFLECRTGVSSWYLNTGEATQVGAVTYPANSCTTGLRVADKLDSTTNNILFKSQKVNSSSCLTSFGTNMYSIGGNIRGNFRERAYNSGANSSKKADENLEYFGGLNVGLYRRTKYSDTRVCKCIENGMNNSWVGDDSVTKIYAPYGQEKLVGKSVYAFKLDVRTPGNLTIYHLKGKSLDAVQVIDKYTHYVRAVGLQTIHLPFDIKINSTDEYIGFGGFHCKSTSDNIVKHSCQWCYLDVSQASWMTTIDNNSKKFYSIGLSNTDYPEKFTNFETNSNYVNIELICRGEKRSPLEDKYISFTGDSITTFAGFCTTKTGYPEGNPAGDNAIYYPTHGKVINNVDATWWGILARDNRMKILRNDAWSGSRVSSSEGSTDTKCLCGANRRYYLRNGYNFETKSTYPFGRPEIIVSMIGTNDLSGNVELGSEMFKGIFGAEEEYKTILSAFSLFCRRIHDQEGNGGAKIVHFLIPRGSDYGYANANGVTIADLSLHFERIAKAWGQYFIPLSYFNGIKPNAPKRWSCPTGSMFKNTTGVEFPSGDGLHPNAMGMEVIADGVHRFLCSIM